jgi:hypothetical protein
MFGFLGFILIIFGIILPKFHDYFLWSGLIIITFPAMFWLYQKRRGHFTAPVRESGNSSVGHRVCDHKKAGSFTKRRKDEEEEQG